MYRVSDEMIPGTDNAARIRQGIMETRARGGAPIANPPIHHADIVADRVCRIHSPGHVGPGAVPCGGATVGEGTFVGAESVVTEGVTTGSRAPVGLGAEVLRIVADCLIVMGKPSRGTDAN